MDENRRPTRYLDSKDESNRASTAASSRAATADSGLGSISVSERSTTLDSRATNGTLSSLSRDTPINAHEDIIPKERHDDRPVRIRLTPTMGNRCYQQAYVSYVDHPSGFFLQLAQFEKQFTELDQEINEFYLKNSLSDSSIKWKRGDYCIAKFKDNKFYRARIIEIPEVTKTPNVYDVIYVDFGNWDKVASINIHTLLPKFAILTAQAIPCSLTKSLPRSGTWFDHPLAMKLFEDLVLDKYVDATFYMKPTRDFWPIRFVDLKISSTEQNVREIMKDRNLIREVPNEDIYKEFYHLLRPVDLIIYSIPHEDEGNNDDDDD